MTFTNFSKFWILILMVPDALILANYTIYVDNSYNGYSNGSYLNPYTTLGDALENLSQNNTNVIMLTNTALMYDTSNISQNIQSLNGTLVIQSFNTTFE